MPHTPTDFLFAHIRDLPYFRGFLRAIESAYYQDLLLPAPTLDVGCGDGNFAALTFPRKLDVGLDPWHAPIHEAKTFDAYLKLIEADGGKMPFPDAFFASGLSNSVLEHIPHIDAVLAETARVLQPGAPFYFCIPNTRYLTELDMPRKLRALGLNGLAARYTEWFRVMSRVAHADDEDVWEARLQKAGFTLERSWRYFSPDAMRVLEWGHYFGAPTLLPRLLFKRWILAPTRWNLALTEAYLRPFVEHDKHPQGVFTFYIAKKVESGK
jgi:SAM-dependent methyltransferase